MNTTTQPISGQDVWPIIRSNVTHKYADFSGNAGRHEFWIFFAARVAVSAVVYLISEPLGLLVIFALLCPALAIGARRLHDIGLSGWWQLLMLIPFAGAIALIVMWCQPTKLSALDAALADLASLHDRGLLTDDEYADKAREAVVNHQCDPQCQQSH
jgi:uncharacterized membrane protein YhaH (DUF805 family)